MRKRILLARELEFYLELLSPSPPPVVHLPGLEVDPYRGLSPHPEIAAARAQAIWQLLQDGPKVLVASAQAAAVRLHGPQRFLSHCLELKPGDEWPPERARRFLQDAGYVEDDPVTDPGEFSLRGGILDVFPPHMQNPVRLEFFGDQIESLRSFDVDTQRSISAVERIEIIPMREYCHTAGTAAAMGRQRSQTLWSAPFLPHLEEEIALARQGETFPAFEFMLPAVDPLDKTLFDYLPGYRIITCDREVIENTIVKYHEELYDRFLDRIEAHKPVLAPEQIYLTGDEFTRLPLTDSRDWRSKS